jgi:SAM-dependent methyltransferase
MSNVTGNCLLCNGTNPEVIEECKKGFNVLKCIDCGLVYVSPLPEKVLIESAHSNSYYAPWLEDQRSKRIQMWEKRLRTLNSLSVNKDRLLDIGCAEGLFPEVAGKDGWDVTGTEISHFAAQYGKEKLGLNIIQGELIDMKFPDNTFDAITMWHVLEHTRNPIAVLREIRRIIKDNGIFILAIPNLNNFLFQLAYRLIRGRRMHLFDPDDRELHLYHFTPETIRMTLEKTGFSVQKILPDMGIVQRHIKVLNYIASAGSFLTGRIITDAIEVHIRPV